VLGLVVGAQTPAEASELGARLNAAARRQHGMEVESLGELTRDAESYRVLLRGESLHALGEGSETAQSLRALCQRLSAGRGARRAARPWRSPPHACSVWRPEARAPRPRGACSRGAI